MELNESNFLNYNGKFYDQFEAGSPYYLEQQKDIDFWIEIAKKYGDSVLELACGTGRITVPLAQEGVLVTGIDISDSMLEVARKKSSQVEWIKADVRDFELKKKFSLIIFPYNALHHLLHVEEVESCFSCVRRHLQPGGKFVVDITNPSPKYLLNLFLTQENKAVASVFPNPDGTGMIEVTRSREYTADQQILKIKRFYKFVEQAKEVVTEMNFRLYFPQEFDTLLKYNGFTIEQQFGDYNSSSFTPQSPQKIVICNVCI